MHRGKDGDASATGNRYCERAGLTSVPRVEDALVRGTANLFQLMVVALLERGGPMTVEEIADRLTDAGAVAGTGDMVLSLKKAWHGREPVFRDPDGRLAINLSSPELRWVVLYAGLRPPRAQPPTPPPEPAQPGDDIPLTEDELTAAFHDRSLFGLSAYRQAAAVLDVRGHPMTVEEVEQVLASMTQSRFQFAADRVRLWRTTLVNLDEHGRLTLDRTDPGLGAMRQAVRKLARSVLIRQAQQERSARNYESWKARQAEEQERQAREAERLRRAVLRALPEAGVPQAFVLLDVGVRSIRTFIGSELAAAADVLADFDILVGLHIRDTLYAMGVDPDCWQLVDLKPPRKSRRINRAGRVLKVMPELLISSTTGINRPLGDPAKVAQYLVAGESGKLRRRLESDVKALHAFYRYGVLHRCVRLRWGFLDELLPVDWALPGEPSVYDILEHAHSRGEAVDLVVGAAPGWSDPWSRARRGYSVAVGSSWVAVRLEHTVWQFDIREIQAVRGSAGVGGT